MTVTVSSFRADLTEFADNTIYPDSDILFWLNYAGLLLNANRWKSLLDLGTEMFIAHNLVLEQQAKASDANGAPPGLTSGLISSKSVDKVSISFDTNNASEKDAGYWNLTTYGMRYFRLMRMFGAGPIQVGIGCAPSNNGPAWPGVVYPFADQ